MATSIYLLRHGETAWSLTGRHFALDTGSVSILGYEHRNEDVPIIFRWNNAADTG